jgi:Uncharacterised methyltransferase family (DUF6094)
MALIFPRLAQNFVKNGYFPTDVTTLTRISRALDVSAGDQIRLLDPCCGEGVALSILADNLRELSAYAQTYGVEIDAERAWHAKQVLQTVGHCDIHDVMISQRSFGLLFLNPPYGDVLSDKAQTGDTGKRERHEKIFCRRTFSLLQFGGVLVLIVPFYIVDQELATLIARHFDRVQAFMAPEQQFKQCVIFGIKRRAATPDPELVKSLTSFGKGEQQRELPESWTQMPYEVPASPAGDTFAFSVARLDPRQLEHELQTTLRSATMWPKFRNAFGRSMASDRRRPLCNLSRWHLALALAAGQIRGVVSAPDGRRYLVKGDTHKDKSTHIEYEPREDGSMVATTVATDKFVPVIRAIDFTPGPTFGRIVTIR